MDLQEFKKKLKSYSKEKIKFTYHAEIRAITREIGLNEVRENIINPKRLIFVEE
jgi:hypothetical protein